MLVAEDEVTKALTDLGLTISQARVYFQLSRSGICTAKTISKISRVAREHIYEVMPQLHDLGLVEKIIGVPSKFRALSIQDGLHLLLRRRAIKTHELQGKTKEIVTNWVNNNLKIVSQESDDQFILIPGKKALNLKIKEALFEARESLCCLGSHKKISQALYAYTEELSRAINRGVKVKIVTETGEDKIVMPEKLEKYHSSKEQNLEIRYVLNQLTSHILVVDKKQVLINTSLKSEFAESPALWSNNSSIVSLAQDHFDIIFLTSQKEHMVTSVFS